jgi:hypothetical protein
VDVGIYLKTIKFYLIKFTAACGWQPKHLLGEASPLGK